MCILCFLHFVVTSPIISICRNQSATLLCGSVRWWWRRRRSRRNVPTQNQFVPHNVPICTDIEMLYSCCWVERGKKVARFDLCPHVVVAMAKMQQFHKNGKFILTVVHHYSISCTFLFPFFAKVMRVSAQML
jgi:hypothetical protein